MSWTVVSAVRCLECEPISPAYLRSLLGRLLHVLGAIIVAGSSSSDPLVFHHALENLLTVRNGANATLALRRLRLVAKSTNICPVFGAPTQYRISVA